jgi:methionine-rich copper-binding protein CopC
VIDMTGYNTVNGIGFGVVSVSGAAPGTTGGAAAAGLEVSVTTAVADSLIVSAYASNTNPVPGVPSGDSKLYASGAIGSASGAAAYRTVLGPAGVQTVTYTQSSVDGNSTAAAAFSPLGPPLIASTAPADNATNVAIGTDLVATFTKPVQAGTGNIELWQVGGGSALVTFDVASSPQLTFSGSTVTINLPSNLTPGVEYYVLIGSTAVVGTDNTTFAGISDPTTWSFTTDNTPPTLVTVNPADDAPAVPVASNLVATFSEPVVAGTGNIELRQANGSLVESFDVASSPQLTFSGATLTIDPTANLVPGTGYYVLIGSTAVVDTSGNAFAGISDPTAWNFTGDATPPILASLSPADGALYVAVNANLAATFSEAVAAGTGNIELWQTGGGSPIESFDVSSSTQITFAGAKLTIDPTANLSPDTGYYVTIPSTAVVDLSGNAFAGLAGPGAWNFTTLGAVVPITVVNNNGPGGFVQAFPPTINTFSFDAGSTAGMLVVAYASELGGAVAGASVDITYDGFALTRANTGGGFLAEIYYLDLSTTSYTGGAADLVVDLSDYSFRNGLGIGVVSISAGGQPILLHTTADGGGGTQSVTLTTTAASAFAVAGFNSNNGGGTPAPAVSSPLTQIYASNNIGSARGAAGYESSIAAGDHTYTWTLPDTNPEPRRVVAAAFVAPATGGGNNFADWIATFSGLGGLTAVGDDPDGDGIDNGVENFFGTHPGTFSQGLLVGIKSGNTFTFTHPQNASPASDLSASYSWSKDLASFLASGATDGAGTTVAFTTQANTPSLGITTVTATVTGTAAGKLFVRVNVTQP